MSELDRVLDELHADQRATDPAAGPDSGDGARAVGDADQGARPPVLSGADKLTGASTDTLVKTVRAWRHR